MSRRAASVTIKPANLAERLAAKSVDSVLIQSVKGGFHTLIGFSDEAKPLGLARGDRERVFKTPASAASYFTKLGIEHFSIDMTHRSPAQVKSGRRPKGPDRHAACERTQEAVSYNAFLHESVEEALTQIDAGTVELISWGPEESKALLAEALAKAEAKRQARAKSEVSKGGLKPSSEQRLMAKRAASFTIKPDLLEDLLSADALDSVLIQGVEGGFHILIGFGDEEKPLGLAKEDRERMFKTLTAATNYLAKLGIEHFSLDMTQHSPPPKLARRSKGPRHAKERAGEATA